MLSIPRKPWHLHWMEEAYHSAERSTCQSGRQVGCVAVRNNSRIASGYNGVPPAYPHPTSCARREANLSSGQGLDLCPCIHAEMNMVARAAREGVNLDGAFIYTTTQPCQTCMGMLAGAGIVKIYYHQAYPHATSQLIADFAGIQQTNLIFDCENCLQWEQDGFNAVCAECRQKIGKIPCNWRSSNANIP